MHAASSCRPTKNSKAALRYLYEAMLDCMQPQVLVPQRPYLPLQHAHKALLRRQLLTEAVGSTTTAGTRGPVGWG